jgi:hypothetical protein
MGRVGFFGRWETIPCMLDQCKIMTSTLGVADSWLERAAMTLDCQFPPSASALPLAKCCRTSDSVTFAVFDETDAYPA